MKVRATPRQTVQRAIAPAVAQLALASLGGAAPIPVMCCVLPNGDVLIPTGSDSWLSGKDGAPVQLEFRAHDGDRQALWSVTRLGQAERFATARRAHWALPATGALALRAAFQNVVRVQVRDSAAARAA